MNYTLITPARNEESYIEKTIRSVVSQTIKPLKWVIVSDGSTDGTDDIVKRYIPVNPWIELIRMPEHRDRQFAAKVQAFNAGYDVVKKLEYDVIASLDADISFDPDYFAFLLAQLENEPRLGVTGTPFVEDGQHYDYRFTNIEHVSGACQVFRRKCFEQIGGYVPIKGGGIDWTAVTTARMKGWKTRTFTEKVCHHHKKMGSGNYGKFYAIFKHGKKDYFLGGDPLWQVFRSIYQLTKKPYLISGLFLFAGYFWAMLSQTERQVSDELMRFNRCEQRERLKKVIGF
jgi:glycosyltransferase involved in cell wall biosynthesis